MQSGLHSFRRTLLRSLRPSHKVYSTYAHAKRSWVLAGTTAMAVSSLVSIVSLQERVLMTYFITPTGACFLSRIRKFDTTGG